MDRKSLQVRILVPMCQILQSTSKQPFFQEEVFLIEVVVFENHVLR